MFPKLKMELKGDRLASIGEIQEAVMRKLNLISKNEFSKAMEKLEEHANRCIKCNGDYFE